MFHKLKKTFAALTLSGLLLTLAPLAQAQDATYQGANGQIYTEADFKSDQTTITPTNNDGYATFCWQKPEKYFEGYMIYAREGEMQNITNEAPLDQNKNTNCYTFPKQFNYDSKVSIRVHAYIELKDGAKKFLQPGYATTQSVLAKSENKFFNPIAVKAVGKNKTIQLDWEALPGLGVDFDKYLVTYKQGSFNALTGDVAKSYVEQDYFNWSGLGMDEEWTFQVVPVKMKDGKYVEVGYKSAIVKAKTEADEAVEELGPVTLTGKGVEGGIQLSWNELAGMGTKFERYGIIWKEGYFQSLTGSVANASVLYNYYNLSGLKNNTYYTFQVVPVKIANGSSTEVGYRSTVLQVKTLGPATPTTLGIPGITQPANNTTLTNYPRYAYLVWTSVAGADKYQIEIACDVCVSTANKWQNPNYYTTKYNYYTTPALAGDNEFRFRVRAMTDAGKVGEWSDYRYFRYSTKAEPQPEPATTQIINLDYRYYRNGVNNPAESGSITIKISPDNSSQLGYNFHEGKYTSHGDGAFYTNNTEGAVKFYGNNVGQGGLVQLGHSNIDEIKPPTETGKYYRFGLKVESGQLYGVYDEKHGTFATMRITGMSPPAKNDEQDSISLSIASWTEGAPKITWTPYGKGPFDGYAIFVRQGTWDKEKTTWADPFYVPKEETTRQLTKMFTNTDYSVRVIAYVQTPTGKLMLYPASNVVHFKTGDNIPTPATSCGNSAGDDGLYGACKGDSIDHEPSGLTATVLKITKKYVKLSLDSANKKVIVVKLGKSKTVIADTDTYVTYKYTEKSDKFGAFIQITSYEVQ